MRKSVIDRINDRLKQLEVKTAMPVAVPGEDLGLRTPRELTCMAFGGNISEEEFPFVWADPAWKAHALALLETTRQCIEALNACLDSMSAPAMERVVVARREHARRHVGVCFWLRDKKNQIRQHEAKRIRDQHSPPMNFDQWGE